MQKIEDCAANTVLNWSDVREGSQGTSHPPSILLPPLLSKVFLTPTPLRSLPGHPRSRVLDLPTLSPLLYFDAGAGVDVLGAGAAAFGAGVGVAGVGAGFTAAVLEDDVVGAAEL